MKNVSKKDLFTPIVDALRADAERLKLDVSVMPETIWKVGIRISSDDININVPVEITDVETIRFLMQQVVSAHGNGVAKGRCDTQLAVLNGMGISVNEDGFLKL